MAGDGRKWATPGIVVQAARRRPTEIGEGEPRVGFTASRKVGNAVARNRARRRLRAAAAEILPGCARPGHDYVLIARRSTPSRPFGALKNDLEVALDRLGAGRGSGRR